MQQEKAILASGCFWGTEYHFAKAKGIIATTVGFCGGHVLNPSYKQVCAGTTGHLEAVEVTFNKNIISYEQVLHLFFETHDFSQLDGQGPDIGPQYLSAIFALSNEQVEVANKVIEQLINKGFTVATEIKAVAPFYPAEDYHQKYYFNKGSTPYCHIYRKIF